MYHHIKGIKYLGINLLKETKNLYLESYKMLMKEIEDNTDRKIYHVLGLEQSTLSKWLYNPSQSTDSMQYLATYQWHFSQNQNKKKKLNFYGDTKDTK